MAAGTGAWNPEVNELYQTAVIRNPECPNDSFCPYGSMVVVDYDFLSVG